MVTLPSTNTVEIIQASDHGVTDNFYVINSCPLVGLAKVSSSLLEITYSLGLQDTKFIPFSSYISNHPESLVLTDSSSYFQL